MNRLSRDLVQELATLLVKAMQLDQAYDKSGGPSHWVRLERQRRLRRHQTGVQA